MDLALDYLARTSHEHNVAAADRVNEYRRIAAERRALATASPDTARPDITQLDAVDAVDAVHAWWFRALLVVRPTPSHGRGHDAALAGRP